MIFDVAILGAGPAGVVCAKTLTGFGYRVVLFNRPRRYPAIEGMSERALNGLRFAGCERALQQVTVEAIRLACWNGEQFSGNREWIVDREQFDAALLMDASDSKIEIINGRVKRFQQRDNLWSLYADGLDIAQARFVIDARGRAAPHTKAHLQRGPATIALGRCWRLISTESAGTRVATFADGWLWFAADEHDYGILQLFVSTEQENLPPRAKLSSHYQTLLAQIPEAKDWLHSAQPQGAVFARYAHPQCTKVLIDANQARVGDAAFAIDPLSGHGLFEAIGGALALAASVNTILAKPQDIAIAEQFYQEKISTDFLRMSRIGRDFYRLEQRWLEQPFWQQRQHWPDEQAAHTAPTASKPSIATRPVNVDGFIVNKELIVTADHPRGIWQVAGVELVPLLRELQRLEGRTLMDIATDYAVQTSKPPNTCHTALAWLKARGFSIRAELS